MCTFDILQILASKNGELNFVQKFFDMGADVTALDQDKVLILLLLLQELLTNFV